jgi:hypothetical protein
MTTSSTFCSEVTVYDLLSLEYPSKMLEQLVWAMELNFVAALQVRKLDFPAFIAALYAEDKRAVSLF